VPAAGRAAADGVDVRAAGDCHRLAAAGVAAAAVDAASCGRVRVVAQQVPYHFQLAKAIPGLVEPARV
jgi:hypothetical protein